MTRPAERLRSGGIGLIAWTLCVASASAESATAPLPPLDTPIERRLSDDEAHHYTLPGDRGDLWIVVDQRGIDVELVTTTATGDETPVDQPGERWGVDWLRLPADDPAAGSSAALLTIRPATPGSGPGRYRLRVEARGETSELRRGIAERAVTAAARLYPAWNREAWAEAAEHYARAIDHWRAVGADAEAARTVFLHALLLRQLDELDAASTGLHRALDLWRRLGDRQGQALASMELGNTAHWRGEQATAETWCRRALELWRALDDAHGRAATHNYLGLIRARDDPRTAVESYRRALDHFRQVGDAVQEGVLLNNLGGTHHLLGEPHEALGYFRRAAEIHERRGDLLHQAIAWANIASVHRRTGRLHDAIDGYQRSLDARRASEDVRGEARVLNNLGSTWLRLGDAERARDVLRQALVRRRESGDRRGEAITLHNLGTVHEATSDWHAMLDVELQALAIRRALGDRVGEATSLRAIGQATGRLGRLAEARRHFADAAAILDQAGATWLGASVAHHLGETLTHAGAIDEAIEALGRALELYRQTGDVLGEGETLVALARAEHAASRSATAFGHIDQALDRLESVRANVDHLGLRSSFFSDQAPAFELAIELAMDRHRQDPEAGWDRRAFAFSERSRARSLLDWLGESRSPGDLDPALLDRQRRLVETLNTKIAQQRRALRRARDATRFAAEAAEIRTQLETIETEIRRQSTTWEHLSRPQPLDADAARALLDATTLLVVYSLGETRSVAWVVDRDRIESVELADRSTIRAAARALHEAWRAHDPRARDADRAVAGRLAGLVLEPIRHRLTDDRRLAVVADDALHLVPFAALPDPTSGRPLLADREIVSLPSASTLAVQRRRSAGRSAAPRPLAVLADPVYTADDPRLGEHARASLGDALDLARLPWSAWEADRIAGWAGSRARVDAGVDATLDAVHGGQLGEYRIVHFATHGLIDSERPELSALVLSRYDAVGQAREGFLRLPDIAHLDLDADLVVLSGCRTALGPEIRGEGWVGLGRGFFAAGTRRVIASLWRVQDRSAAELMDRFYRHLFADDAPASPPAALRRAQLELRAERGYADPYHWAAFTLVGDWR